MRWSGQHIYDLISRFRDDVYIEDNNLEISKVSGQPTLELSAWSATATSAHAGRIKFLKSGTAAVDTYTAGNHTTAGEILGRIEAYGIDDGDGETLSSYIEFANDAISDADSSPGKIIFATSDADDAGTPTVRLTIDDGGLATFTGGVTVDGAITGDVTGNASGTAATVTGSTQAAITTCANLVSIGSINTGSWRGSVIASGFLDADTAHLSGTQSFTGVKTFDETIAGSVNGSAATVTAGTQAAITTCTNLVTTGTIGTGVWEGTAVASNQQKHLMHYQFLGYTTGDGSNYEMPQNLTDAQAPFEHADTSSADGLTVPGTGGDNQRDLIRMGGHLMVNIGTLKEWRGIATNNNNKDLTLGLFKWTPTNNSAGDMTPVLLEEVVIDGKGQDLTVTFSTTSFDATVAVGDIIFTQMKTETSGNVGYFNSTLEIEFDG